jgi:16S rRNA (guanine1516-N2)-methyltransferase
LIVTTAEKPDEGLIRRALQLAQELNADYVERRRDTLRGLERMNGGDGVLVVSDGQLRYVSEDQKPMFFHPSMGLIRIKRLLQGDSDTMISISGAQRGDSVLDCTAGLASDAIVFSHVTGEEGCVTALEASRLLYVIVREGLQTADTGLSEADSACRRVTLRLGDHAEVLGSMVDRSVDIVYFDPMFDRPVQSSASLTPLRSHARHDAVSEETIRQAVRVARKSVVLKNTSGSSEFARLGFTPARVSASAVSYGVIRVDA